MTSSRDCRRPWSSRRKTIRCDEGEAYARKLKAAGIDVTAVSYNGMIHDFVLLNAIRALPEVGAAIDQASDGIRRRLQPYRWRVRSEASDPRRDCAGR